METAKNKSRPSFFISRWIFLKLLGCIYLIAFLSFYHQSDGLIGQNGILPVQEFLERAARYYGSWKYFEVPTLCWIGASDSALHVLCLCGMLCSVLFIFGICQGPIAILLWMLHLSLISVGQVFYHFQWDSLLLETGILSVFIAPWKFRSPISASIPPRVAIYALQFLLFRLMFSSGAVKLLSGDETWANLTALTYHYETQPLPTFIGYYAHQLSTSVQKFSVISMFIIELLVPFFIFAGSKARYFACGIIIFFQSLIALTGNYTYFNLLTCSLCVLLLDDLFLRRWFKISTLVLEVQQSALRQIGANVLPGVLLVLQVAMLSHMAFGPVFPFSLARPVLRLTQPFDLVNSYGLFAVMTTKRYEIIIQGSNDRETWFPYEFKWKPGDEHRRPGFVAPYQPRLDWQMWFAALSNIDRNPWLTSLLLRLLQGKPEVVALFETNPFPITPPKFIRSVIYEYHFTTSEEKRRTGNWWKSTLIGNYSSEVSLKAK